MSVPVYQKKPRFPLSFLFPSLSPRKNQTSGFFFLTLLISPGLSAVQDLDEGFAKLDVESSVDDRVDGAVEVSKPGDSAVQCGRDTAAPAVGLQHVCQEERQPANNEHTLETGRGSGLADECMQDD